LDKATKIPYKSLKFIQEIGAGSFGTVYLGEWQKSKVALKVGLSSVKDESFLKELKLTIGIQPHPNIVQTLGLSFQSETNAPILVLEYCAGGSLDKKLFDSSVKISEAQQIDICLGIASGMLHLHANNIIHRDLAARNILLSSGGVPKISDFGMSRKVDNRYVGGNTKNDIGPIRWMSPESLKTQQYSVKSDIWSFGILIYEIVARQEPHANEVDQFEVAQLIRDQSLIPKISKEKIYSPVLKELMEKCWNQDPQKRPNFETICTILQQQVQ